MHGIEKKRTRDLLNHQNYVRTLEGKVQEKPVTGQYYLRLRYYEIKVV